MKLKYEDGRFTFTLSDVTDHLTDEEKLSLIEALSCEEAIIKHVADQILDGWTENGWHGPRGGITDTAYGGLDSARRRIALGANKIARKEIEGLIAAVQREKESAQRAWDMYHEDRRNRCT